VRPREERVFGEEVFDGEVGRPAVVVGERGDELRLGLHADEVRHLARRDAAPDVAEPRPARDAVEVREDLDGRELHELVQRPLRRSLDEAGGLELPRLKVYVGRAVRVEHGPLARARLAGRQALVAPRVGAHDHVPARLERVGARRVALLVERVFDETVEKTHRLSTEY
jgi:hypothetical protein